MSSLLFSAIVTFKERTPIRQQFLPLRLLGKFAHFWNILPSQGPDHPNHSLFCPLSSLGPDGSASRGNGAHACCQVSVYFCLSLLPQDCNPLLCSSVPVLHWRSARYHSTISRIPSAYAHGQVSKPPFTFASRQHLQRLGPGSDFALSTVGLLLGADCLQ